MARMNNGLHIPHDLICYLSANKMEAMPPEEVKTNYSHEAFAILTDIESLYTYTRNNPRGTSIDPDNELRSWNFLLLLDDAGIYGDRIVKLHKTAGGGDLETTCAIITASQFGAVDLNKVLAQENPPALDKTEMIMAVRAVRPTFAQWHEVPAPAPQKASAPKPPRL